ncbi:Predicted oxidoreductase, contains short-chain dehydrogenase (SDR) and DUF2520 domains [Pustulibacterium marinum]|uniref:Predicted oxidoreductase, contains short-chain dehydrogenase (SDR) and DUF2520 domains n=1 Tax=Pustulibacterium marinum TaxID=1224947 RepID=A0A1I7H766_9FLAO|nr:Rossmann-like and DUF2520 domain-containing protein [Pustulibacterium marinum]SFU56532.1 Predicted oxidoreductase, contains short-chain dehydrogenase (SDR) and DUF2520 domains [Pustulibacterium marinum]
MISVSIIGAGNVAFHLSKAFYQSESIHLHQIYSRSPLTEHYKNIQVPICHSLEELKEADVYIISVSDDAVIDIASQLPFEKKLVVHTTGSVSLQDLPSKNRRGVFYPLQTFSKNKKVALSKVPFCLEADEENDLETLKSLATAISHSVYEIDSEQRKTIHLAAVFVSNFVNHIYHITKDISDQKNIPFQIFQPLMEETLDKLQYLSPLEAQTGPARRNDQQTIDKHLSLLDNETYKNLYQQFTTSILKTYERKEL